MTDVEFKEFELLVNKSLNNLYELRSSPFFLNRGKKCFSQKNVLQVYNIEHMIPKLIEMIEAEEDAWLKYKGKSDESRKRSR